MRIEEMHYDYKVQLNELDSNQYRGLLIPQIDWALNQAQMIFITAIAEPRTGTAFETNQRTIDDIRTLVVNGTGQNVNLLSGEEYTTTLPTDYLHMASLYVRAKKNKCIKKIRGYKVRHEDLHEESAFSKSSFEWEEVNYLFFENKLKLFAEDFILDRAYINYIRKPKYMHNAKDFEAGEYALPDGTILRGKQDSELPETSHRSVVSLAVLLTTGNLRLPDYETKLNQFKLN